MVFEIFCCIVVVLFAFYYYNTVGNNFWKIRQVPGPAPTFAFGNGFKVMFGKESFAELCLKVYNEYKNEPLVGIFMRTQPILIVQDPDIIKDVLIKDFSKFANRGFMKAEPTDPISQHLFALEVKRWRPLRSHLSPVFTCGKLKGMFSLVLECSNHLVKYLDSLVAKGEPIEMREVSAKFTTDVIGSCAFGIDMNSLSDKESQFRRIGKEIVATNFLKVLNMRVQEILPLFGKLINHILPENEAVREMIKMTTETIDYRDKNNIVRHDFMNLLLELKKHPERAATVELTDELLAAQAFSFFAAGFETSATTISNALYELAARHDMQDKLRQEIRQFEEKYGGEWKYETIREMQYLDKVFLETLRKYPALPFLSRETVEEYTFEDRKVTIPKDTIVWIPTFPIHRDHDIYPNPEKFDPERFSEDMVKARHPMHYLPFGHGPRNCIGARFAADQTKIGLIKILRNYKVDICDKTPMSYEIHPLTFVLQCVAGMYLKVTKIEN